jgi:predicted N-acyltransferase
VSETVAARIHPGVAAIDAAVWDGLGGAGNPFTAHAFLTALEDSGSVGRGTGWTPAPITLEDAEGRTLAAIPSYLKGHSQGEYVFDHGWAEAYEQAGGRYYPKLQIAAPFTPATGPRVLARSEGHALAAIRAAEAACRELELSSAHATFIEPPQVALFEQAGWLLRRDIQFHWRNRNFASFDDFLATLSSRKRKDLRKERATAQEGVAIEHLRGDAIRPEHWDAFWLFYQDTGYRKWGRPYLTRAAFDLFGERLGDQLLLILAYENGEPIAGALNFIGSDALYGRYWGCTRERRFLHFELCYYQAIDAAIAMGLQRVEAGAQGGHKLVRGYEPVETMSAHWIADPGFRAAVADFLAREREDVAFSRTILDGRTPFRRV